jgi:hypothetical protein
MSPLAPRLLACALAITLLGCADDPPPTLPVPGDGAEIQIPEALDPEVPEGPAIDVEAPPATPPTKEEVEERQEAWRNGMNEHGRGLLDSFERRVYEPTRDASLRYAEGIARVRVDDVEGAYRISYDPDRPEKERLLVLPEGDVDGLPERTDVQIRQFAALSLNGPYRFVVQYLPPIRLWLSRSKDGQHNIVTAPAHKHDLQVSYRFDERELISHRGISVRPQAEITRYEWTFFRGRYLISRFWVHGTESTCDLEYDDRDTNGVVLLKRATLSKGAKRFDVTFAWERVEAGE